MGDDLRVMKTRRNIHTHFIDLLEQQSFRDITVKRITEVCQINRSTFYRNYTDKYDLMRDIMSDVIDDFTDAIDPSFILLPQDDTAGLRRSLEPLLSYFENNKRMLLIIYQSDLPVSISDELLSAFSTRLCGVMVDELQKRAGTKSPIYGGTSRISSTAYCREMLPDIQCLSSQDMAKRRVIISALSQIIASGILVTMKWWHMDNPHISRDELTRIMISSFTDGIAATLHQLLDSPAPATV